MHSNTAAKPLPVDGSWWAGVQKNLTEFEYHASENAHGLQAPNRGHNLRTYFDASGILVHDRTAAGSPKLAGLSLAAMGHGEHLERVPAGTVDHAEARVEIRRPGVIEWYKNSAAGLEQGFTLPERMSGAGALVLELAVKHARATLKGQTIELVTDAGRHLRYGKLMAQDAHGQILESRLAVPAPGRVHLVVNDIGATYPLVIDPLLTAVPDAVLESNQRGSSGSQPSAFGRSVAGAGDVNGDGFADVIVGAWGWDGGASEEGAAFVFLGSPAGLVGADPDTAFARIESNNGAARLGWSVSGAGDVNNDGFADIVVGAYLYSSAVDFEGFGLGTVRGAAFVYLGSATGIQGADDPSLAHARIISNEIDSFLGYSVSGAGDVNGDGFADILVGGPRAGIPFLNPAIPPYDRQGNGGVVLVFLGSAAGITGTGFADAHKELRPYVPGFPEQVEGTIEMGISVAGAGDVNGDLYDDIIVGSAGFAMLFLGSPAGIVGDDPTTAHARIDSDGITPVGIKVAGAGDVNGDGFADIIIGSPSAPVPPPGFSPDFLGAILVFHGSPTGITATTAAAAQTTIYGVIRLQQLGWDVSAAGDVDADGFDDVIAASHNFAGSLTFEGAAYVFRGGPNGITATSLRDDAYVRLRSQQSGASLYLLQIGLSAQGVGDINGDGYADVMLGTGFYDNGEENEGAAFVYHGGVAPIFPNRPPMPVAGAEQSLLDIDNSGSEIITVDGIASLDPDGTIVSYRWLEGEKLLGTSQRLTTSLTTSGHHTLVLTATDNEGLTRGDPVDVSVGLVDRPFVGFEDFSSGGFAGGIGSWVGNWIRAGEVSLSSVDSFPSPPQAQVGASATLSRQATLPVGATGMMVAFNARASQFGPSDTVAVQVSRDGGAFTTLRTFTVADSDDTYKFYGGSVGEGRMTLSWYPFTAANMVLRFASTATTGQVFVDDIQVTALVAPEGEPLPPTIDLPVAHAGADITVDDNDTDGAELVALDGRLSTDADGLILSYEWFEVTSAGTLPLGTGAMLDTSFGHGSNTVLLIVTDDMGGSTTDTMVVTVNQVFPNNLPPVAHAGPDQTIVDADGNTLEVVTFDGSASADPDSAIVAYIWTKNGTFFGNTPLFSVTLPRAVHTVALTVTDEQGATSTDTVVVTVVASGTTFSIDSFTATPVFITVGESTTLSWTTTNADSVSINGSASLPLDGSIVVSPTTNTVYTLSVTGPGGTAIRSVTVGVNQPPPVLPTVESFTAAPTTLTAGESATLTWTTTDADSVSIDGGSSQPAAGSLSVTPVITTTYTLTATGPGGTASSTVTLTVNPGAPEPPTVDSFSAAPTTLTAGESATLSWITTHADSVSIDGGSSQPADGSLSISPASTTTYVLTATGAGGTASSSVTVTVSGVVVDAVSVSMAFDGFESGDFSGGSGAWLGPWIASGDVRIRTDQNQPHTGRNHVRLRRNSGLLQRRVDVSGASEVRLRFWAKIDSFENADIAEVKVSPDGQSFTIVKSYTASDSDNQYHFYDIDLSGFPMTSGFTIIFDAGMSGRGDSWYLDDIEIFGLPPS